MPQPTPDQRKAQFAAAQNLIAPTLAARLASDGAVRDRAMQQAFVDMLQQRLNLLHSRVQERGGASDQDYIDYGITRGQLAVEFPKLEPLREAAEAAGLEFDKLHEELTKSVAALLENPGAVEDVGQAKMIVTPATVVHRRIGDTDVTIHPHVPDPVVINAADLAPRMNEKPLEKR